MKNITILWWFWYWNYWDNLILFNEVKLLKSKYPNSIINIYCWNSKELQSSFKNIWNIYFYKRPPIAIYRLYELLNLSTIKNLCYLLIKTDLFILWWGGFFSDRQFFAIWGWLRYVILFKLFWSKVIGFWMWAGPFFYKYNKFLIKFSGLFFDDILLRDTQSVKYFSNTGFNPQKIHRVIDPAFFMEINEKNVKNKNLWFIIKDNYAYFIKEINNLLEYDLEVNISLIITDTLDLDLNEKVLNYFKNSIRVKIINESDVLKLSKIIASMHFIFSQRLHWSILAYSQKTPFCNIYYHHKWRELINLLWIENFSIYNKELWKYQLINILNNIKNSNMDNINLTDYKNIYLWKI